MKTTTTTTTLTTTLFAVFTLLLSFPVFAAEYEETMAANLQKLSTTRTVADFTILANQFERIANAEPTKWHPRYYTAFCYVTAVSMNQLEAEEVHKQLDMAQKHLDMLEKQGIKESEIQALQAFVYQLRITDMAKGMKYSMLAGEQLDEAEKLNPNNPRIYYLRGMNIFHTPKSFGGGANNAKPLFEKAAALFKSQKPATALEPNWGEWHNNKMLAECNNAG